MPILLDQSPVNPALGNKPTIGDALIWVQRSLPPGKIVTKVELDDTLLEGVALANARAMLLGGRKLSVKSSDQKELSLTMLGKLAALIEWIGPQHKEIAALLEKGDSTTALDRLGHILACWQQIQQGYGNLAKLNNISPATLPVRDLTGEVLLEEFCRQLAEMQGALQNRDFVMLADILQYEMDGAIANWMSLLEATLGLVEPAAATA